MARQVLQSTIEKAILENPKATNSEIATKWKSVSVQRVSAIRISWEPLMLFVYNYLGYNKRAFKSLEQGSTFTAINKSDLENLKIKLPSNEFEIEKLADIFNTLDYEVEILNKQLNKYYELKKGLIQKIFTGKTRVKEN